MKTNEELVWNLEDTLEEWGIDVEQRDLLHMWLETKDETIGTLIEDATVNAFEHFVYDV